MFRFIGSLSTRNTTENKCIISHAQNTTACRSNVVFNLDTSVTDHKQGTVCSPLR